MNLPKAIEILSSDISDITILDIPDFLDALKLGVEALKLKQRLNSWSWYWHENLLPGETED